MPKNVQLVPNSMQIFCELCAHSSIKVDAIVSPDSINLTPLHSEFSRIIGEDDPEITDKNQIFPELLEKL